MKRSVAALLAAAATVGESDNPRDRRSARADAAWAEYRRPGGHKNAKAAARANVRRKMEKKTRKAQRRNR